MGEAAAEAVELPDDEHVARPERAHAAVKSSDWEPAAFETRAEPISMCRKRPFATHRQGRRQPRVAVCRIPCLILCLADVDIWARYLLCECVDWLDDTLSTNSQAGF